MCKKGKGVADIPKKNAGRDFSLSPHPRSLNFWEYPPQGLPLGLYPRVLGFVLQKLLHSLTLAFD